MLHDMTGADSSVSKCYFTRAKSGVLMKSLTIAIRNREQRVIGLLCINMNLDVPFSQIMSTFVPPETPDVGSSVNFASSVEDLVTQTLEFTIEEVNADRNVSNNAKNRQIVLNLYEKGIFDIKDAINQVADRLNISKHTVYLYIRQFKSGKNTRRSGADNYHIIKSAHCLSFSQNTSAWSFFMHKKSPTGGEDTLYIPFKFYRKVPCVSNKKTLLSWYNERNI